MYQGKNIRMVRKKWKMDQSQFGELLGCKGSNISTYETDANHPSIPVLLRLEEVTGIGIYHFYKRFLNPEEVPEEPLKTYQISPEGLKHASELEEKIDYLVKEKIDKYLKESKK